MSLNAAELERILAHHREHLLGARLQRVRQSAEQPDTLLLTTHGGGGTLDWVLCTRSPWRRMLPTRRRHSSPAAPDAFVMLARKHLLGARIVGIEHVADDRWFVLRTRRADECGGLAAHLFGRAAAVMLLGPDDRILGRWPPARMEAEPIWHPPPPPDGPSPPLRPGIDLTRPGWAADLEAQYDLAIARSAALQDVDRVRQGVARALRRVLRRRDALMADLERIDEAPSLRHRGDLLQTARGRVTRGASEVTVLDHTLAGSPPVTVPLDPALDLQENIDRVYHAARRLDRGSDRVLERLQAAEDEAEALEQAMGRLDEALAEEGSTAPRDVGRTGRVEQASADAAALLERLAPGETPQARARKRAGASPRLPYIRYLASTGHEILVGRGRGDNDTLTVRIARGHDLWLHAEDWAGAHVVIRRRRDESVPPTAIEEAALLAAHHSRGRSDTTVGVRVTERKHVRKARGMAPGRVYVAAARTVEVSPAADPRLTAVLARRQAD